MLTPVPIDVDINQIPIYEQPVRSAYVVQIERPADSMTLSNGQSFTFSERPTRSALSAEQGQIASKVSSKEELLDFMLHEERMCVNAYRETGNMALAKPARELHSFREYLAKGNNSLEQCEATVKGIFDKHANILGSYENAIENYQQEKNQSVEKSDSKVEMKTNIGTIFDKPISRRILNDIARKNGRRTHSIRDIPRQDPTQHVLHNKTVGIDQER